MALHDFDCTACGSLLEDYYVPITQRATEAEPLCPTCGARMRWVPAVGRMEAGAGPGGFTPFTTQVLQPDGTHKPVTVSTLSDIRRLERETERAQRNGEGQQMIWRDYSQDRSNTHVHTMGEDPATKLRHELSGQKVRARLSVTRHGETAPQLALGAGVTESTTSALGAD